MDSRFLPTDRRAIARGRIAAAVVLVLVGAAFATVVLNPSIIPTVPSASLVPTCAGPLQRPYLFEVMAIPAGQELDICVEFYYYGRLISDTGPIALSPYGEIRIESLQGEDASANFTVGYSVAGVPDGSKNFAVKIGGLFSENEGYLVEYRISPNAAAGVSSGTYYLYVEAYLAPDVLGSPPASTVYKAPYTDPISVEDCGQDFAMAVGASGSPSLPANAEPVLCNYTSEMPPPAWLPSTRYTPGVPVAAVVGFTTTPEAS